MVLNLLQVELLLTTIKYVTLDLFRAMVSMARKRVETAFLALLASLARDCTREYVVRKYKRKFQLKCNKLK